MVTNLMRDAKIDELEKVLVNRPNNSKAARMLVSVMDYYLSSQELGAYTNCQRMISTQYRDNDWPNDLLNRDKVGEYYKHWESLLDSMNVQPKILISQIYSGSLHTIGGKEANCKFHLAMFEQEEAISRMCHDCYKIQILPQDLTTLVQTYFILRELKLPRDNARKCMIELREEIPNPYKGYIYCESEEEANFCLDVFQQALSASGVSNVYCGISHGCSEYSIKYPEFKYSNDGTHRSFERPESWDQTETEFFSTKQMPEADRVDYNKQGLTIRDIIAFRTWIGYAEIIGDDSCTMFRDKPTTIPEGFAERIRKQAQQRKTEREALGEKISSNRG